MCLGWNWSSSCRSVQHTSNKPITTAVVPAGLSGQNSTCWCDAWACVGLSEAHLVLPPSCYGVSAGIYNVRHSPKPCLSCCCCCFAPTCRLVSSFIVVLHTTIQHFHHHLARSSRIPQNEHRFESQLSLPRSVAAPGNTTQTYLIGWHVESNPQHITVCEIDD
jgi:hypothetical protein